MDQETALLLIQEGYNKTEWVCVEDCVDDGHYKHDATHYHSVFKRLSDNTYWMIMFTSSYNYGLDEDSLDWCQVQKEEVVTTKWVSVK